MRVVAVLPLFFQRQLVWWVGLENEMGAGGERAGCGTWKLEDWWRGGVDVSVCPGSDELFPNRKRTLFKRVLLSLGCFSKEAPFLLKDKAK